MRFALAVLFILGLSAPLRAAETYPYCSGDTCRLALDGTMTFLFGTLPKDVRAHCVESNAYAMTFDDGPTEHWPEILDSLRKHGIKATFFVVGGHLAEAKNQNLLRRAFHEGHQISNHSLSHPDLMKLSDDEVRTQITATAEAIAASLGSSPDVLRDAKIVRPPFGYIDARVQGIVSANGYLSVRWNSDRGDWELGADKVVLELNRLDRHLGYMKEQTSINRSIIDLNHDFSGATRTNLDTMIERIEAAGYRFVTVSECLGLTPGSR